MQIKFLTLYHAFENVEQNLASAQDSLLYMWQRSLQLKNIKFIPEAKVEFRDYSFFEYPDQEKAKKEVSQAYGSSNSKRRNSKAMEYWWCGTLYTDLDILYNELAEQKRFMELVITIND